MVLPASHKVSRASWYSGYWPVFTPFAYGTFTLYGLSFPAAHSARYLESLCQSTTPDYIAIVLVWALPLSLATTYGISVVFFSCGYLDVSVPHVSLVYTMYSCIQYLSIYLRWVSPFGYLRVDGYLRLTVAFRSLSRPSSASGAKAFTLCSY